MAAKAETSRNEEDWQSNKSLVECNRYLLENGIDTDVTFLVDDENNDSAAETITAHKTLLMSRSPVFRAMLYGVLAERGQIRVTDIHPQAFRQMLNYIYTDEFYLSIDLVAHVLNASNKYLLPGLRRKCAELFKSLLNTGNVCSILNQILIFEETDLNDFCLSLIMRETKKVLESDVFLSISHATLSKILDINTCDVTEENLFKACLKWAEQKCVQDKKEPSSVNIRAALGSCITKFRFSDIRSFARDICPTAIFTKEEENGLFRHLADKQGIPAPTGFHCEARLKPVYVITTNQLGQHMSCYVLAFEISILSNNDRSIKVNKLAIGRAFTIFSVSINYANENIIVDAIDSKNENLYWLKCNTPLIINPGSSLLQITLYDRDRQLARDGHIYGVASKEIAFKDDQIELSCTSMDDQIELSCISMDYVTRKPCIPLVGLEYSFPDN